LAVFGGLLGASAVTAWRASVASERLASRGAVLEASLGDQGSDVAAYLAHQGGTVSTELARVAQANADLVAKKSAAEVLTRKYHLGPDQMRQFSLLARRFG